MMVSKVRFSALLWNPLIVCGLAMLTSAPVLTCAAGTAAHTSPFFVRSRRYV